MSQHPVAVSVPKALLFCYITAPVKETFKKYFASKSEIFLGFMYKKSFNKFGKRENINCL